MEATNEFLTGIPRPSEFALTADLLIFTLTPCSINEPIEYINYWG